jgi:UDP-glucuronate decarboxylase
LAKTCPYGLSPTFAASKLTYEPLPQDDPKQRQPDIALAKRELSWSPKIALRQRSSLAKS